MVDGRATSSGRKRPRAPIQPVVAGAGAGAGAESGAGSEEIAAAAAGGQALQQKNIHGYQDDEHEDEEDEEEARIRALVFGQGESSLLRSFGAEGFGDFGGDVASAVGDGDDAGGLVVAGKGKGSGGAPAWVDDDDANIKVDIAAKNRLKKLRETREERELTGPEFEQRLRSRFASSNMTADWVKAAENKNKARVSKGKRREQGGDSSDDDGDSEAGEEEQEDALLRDSSSLMGGKGGVLEPGYLNIVRCKDANQHDPAKAVVRAVSFHPAGELLLTGGFDKTLRLFQVDGVRNTKMHSIFFDDLPITNAAFTSSDQAVITGRRPFFYSYDVATGKVQKVPRIFSSGRVEKHMETFAASPDGRWLAFVGSEGYVLLLSSKTKQWAADFKLNSPATAVTFTPDSQYILAAGGDGDVYKFDVRSRRCVLRFFNEGGTTTTSLATTSSSSSSLGLTAVGSDSGVVNVYEADTLETGKRVLRPSPLKAVMSLTTPVTTTKFSPDGQMLAIASNQKRDALKVIHSASCTPFTNWPTERTPVRYPFALDFSPGGGFLAVGNDRGCVLLYRLRHYPQA